MVGNGSTDDAKEVTMTGKKLEELKERICDEYCKFPDNYALLYGDTDAAQEALEERACKECPLNEMEDK